MKWLEGTVAVGEHSFYSPPATARGYNRQYTPVTDILGFCCRCMERTWSRFSYSSCLLPYISHIELLTLFFLNEICESLLWGSDSMAQEPLRALLSPASSGGWSHRFILKELLGSSATAQETWPRSMVCPFSGHNLSLILLGMAETHKMSIRKTDECVHTEKCNSLGSIHCKSCCTKWSFPAFPQWLCDRKELSENKCSYQITGIDFLS